jgi:hypothetical protein
MGLFDKIFGSDKIRVQFIDNSTGVTIGVSEMMPDQLPETFSVPTTMHIQEKEWSVDEAIPENSADFIKSRKLTLKLRKIEKINLQDALFTLPTISNEIPMTVDRFLYNDFEVQIHEDDWRQNEFLKTSSFPLIDIEVSKIKEIWENESKKVDDKFTAFKKCHVRSTIGEPALSIDFGKVKQILNTNQIGCLKVNHGFVQNSFALRTLNTTYYGVLIDGQVDHLCIAQWNENTASEITDLTSHFKLVFINWYKCEIITND